MTVQFQARLDRAVFAQAIQDVRQQGPSSGRSIHAFLASLKWFFEPKADLFGELFSFEAVAGRIGLAPQAARKLAAVLALAEDIEWERKSDAKRKNQARRSDGTPSTRRHRPRAEGQSAADSCAHPAEVRPNPGQGAEESHPAQQGPARWPSHPEAMRSTEGNGQHLLA